MTNTVNPDLIKALRDHHKNCIASAMGRPDSITFADICKNFGLEHGMDIRIRSQFSGRLSWERPNALSHADAIKLKTDKLKNPGASLEQDAVNLYADIIYGPRDFQGRADKKFARSGLKKLYNHDLSIIHVHSIFQRLHAYGLLDLLEDSISDNNPVPNFLPKDFGKRIESWKNLPKNRALFAPQTPEQQSESSELAPTPVSAVPAQIDINTIIAKKQKYFDETPTTYILDAFLERDGTTAKEIGSHTGTIFSGIDPLSSSFVKNLLRAVSQINMPPNLKRAASLLWTLGLYDDYAKGVIDDDLKSKRSQENLSNVWVHSLTDADISSYIFESARRLDYLPDLYFMMNSTRSAAKPEHVEKLENWCASRNIDLVQMLMDYELMPSDAPTLDPVDPADVIIADKQRWFDETPLKGIKLFINHQFGLTDAFIIYRDTEFMDHIKKAVLHPNLKHLFRSIGQSKWSDAEKAGSLATSYIESGDRALRAISKTKEPSRREEISLEENMISKLNESFLDTDNRNFVFESARRYGVLPHLYFAINAKDTFIPAVTAEHLQEWCASKGIDLAQMLVDSEFPRMDENAVPEPVDPRDALIAETQKWFDETPINYLTFSLLCSVDSSYYEKSRAYNLEYTEALNYAASKNPLDQQIAGFYRHVEHMNKPLKERTVLILSQCTFTCLESTSGLSKELNERLFTSARMLWNATIINQDKRNYIFTEMQKYGLLPQLYFISNVEDTLLPPETAGHLYHWCAKNGIDLKQMLADFEIPVLPQHLLEPEEIPAPAPEPTDPRDALIAEKQQFFDDASLSSLLETIGESYGISSIDHIEKGKEIRSLTKHVSPEVDFKHSWRYINNAPWSDEDKSFMMLRFFANTTIRIQQNVVIDFDQRRDEVGKYFQLVFNLPDTANYVFEGAKRHGILPYVYFFMNTKDTLLPPSAAQSFRDWCYNKNIDLKQMLADFEIPVLPQHLLEPEDISTPEPTPVNGINIIEVDGTLVEVGRATEMLSVDRNPDDDAPVIERLRVPHVEWLLEDIPGLMKIDGPLTLYRSKHERAKGEDKDFSLQVIEFRTTDGRKHQIATNNWYGGGTYVIKPAIDINPEDPKLVHIPDLLGSGKAWPVRCHNRDQYVISTLDHCERQLGELAPYIPRLSWANKALAVTQTCIDILKETGERIKTNDREALQTGPLRGISTPARVAAAINKGSIGNLGAEDLPGFYNTLFEREPELKAHLRKPTIDAGRVFADAAAFIRANDLVPQKGFLDDIELAGHPADRVCRFFKQSAEGSIVGWREVLPDVHTIPANLDDFMVASGLAVKSDKGELWPNYDHPALSDSAPKQAHG